MILLIESRSKHCRHDRYTFCHQRRTRLYVDSPMSDEERCMIMPAPTNARLKLSVCSSKSRGEHPPPRSLSLHFLPVLHLHQEAWMSDEERDMIIYQLRLRRMLVRNYLCVAVDDTSREEQRSQKHQH